MIKMLKEITKAEFENRFPAISTYGLEQIMPVYLENGVILTSGEWNGESYTVKSVDGSESTYRPVQKPVSYDEDGEPEDWETVGYEEK